MGGKSSKELGERLLEFPLSLSAPAEITAVQAVPQRHIGTMETTGRVRQLDYDKTVVGWVDSKGNAFRNDFNRTKVGHVDLVTGLVYQADYNKTLIGRVDENGSIFASSTVVHASLTDVVIGTISGPKESYAFAACAFLLFF